jgi:hypothetical protein
MGHTLSYHISVFKVPTIYNDIVLQLLHWSLSNVTYFEVSNKLVTDERIISSDPIQ